ncbi:CoA transferase [Dehalococcoidia bacterium]|nr:CoA transferase [Dehalococcoidia bacterium]
MAVCLEGVRILELARYQAGPRGGAYLADMGADVIKLERIGGEELRHMAPNIHGVGVQFACHSRGKRSATINLREQAGREIFSDLVKLSDVVLENFRPGIMAEMGFDYQSLRKLNPTIILCSVSGFGQYGPYRQRGSFDNIGQAASGLPWETGRDLGHPIFTAAPVADRMAAMNAAIGILGALFHRQLTGQGQTLDIAIADSAMALTEVAIAMYNHYGRDDLYKRTGVGTKCKDGWVTVGATTGPQRDKLLIAINKAELAVEPEGGSTEESLESSILDHRKVLAEWAKDKPVSEVVSLMDSLAIPSSPVQTIPEVLEDQQLWDREVMIEMEIEPGSDKTMLVSGSPLKMSRTPTIVNGIPKVGEQNDEIYQDLLGFSPVHLNSLKTSGVI